MTRRLAREDMGLLERAHASRLGFGPWYAGAATLLASLIYAEAPLWPWVALTLGPITLAMVAWSLSRLDGWVHEIYSLLCIAAAVFFVFWARQLPIELSSTAALQWGIWLCWLFGMTVFMGIGWWSSKTKRTEVHLEDEVRGWGEIAQNFGLGKTSRVVKSKDGDGNESGFLVWPRGVYTVKQVLDAREKIEGGMGMPEGSLRLMKSGRDTDRIGYVSFKNNPLTESQLWPGPPQTDDGGDVSCDVAAVVGPREDGITEELPYIDRSNNFVANKLLGGTQGSGKSGGMTLHIADLACRSDVTQWGMDMKDGMEIAPWDRVMDNLATTVPESSEMLEALDAIMDYRGQENTRAQRKNWPITPEYPLLVVWVDELHRLMGAKSGRDFKVMARCMDVMVRLATTGRALGISVNGATQNPTLEATGTSQFRDRLNQRLCFRVEKENHEDYILNGRRAGAHLLDSSASGLCYVQDRDKWTGMPVRYYYVTDWMVEQIAEIRAPGLPLDEGSARAAAAVSPLYAARIAGRYADTPVDGSGDDVSGEASVSYIGDPVPETPYQGPNVKLADVYKKAVEVKSEETLAPLGGISLNGPNVPLGAVYRADEAQPEPEVPLASTPAPGPGEPAVWAMLEARKERGASAKELFEAAERRSSWFHGRFKLRHLESGMLVQPEGPNGVYVLGKYAGGKVSAAQSTGESTASGE